MNSKLTLLSCFLLVFFAACSPRKEIYRAPQKASVPARSSKKLSYSQKVRAYVNQHGETAMQEMRLHKIPASITLAQGILESASGQSELARRSNNHFGIKCHSEWKGKRVYHHDDRRNECFRKYKHPRESFRDHSLFLKKKRYAFLFRYSITDYKAWAKGLRKAGYATDRRYSQKLIDLIERFELHRYDRRSAGKRRKATKKSKRKTVAKAPSTAKVHIIKKGDTLYSLARRYNTSVEKLKRLNNLRSNNISIGQRLKVN